MSHKQVVAFLGVLVFAGSSLLAGTARGEDEMWMTNFEAAKAKAKTEKKLLLVDFTGSDWCGWCIKLREEVFDKPEFKEAAPKKFVLVELDFPQKKVLSPELKAQNAKLQEEFKIQGFPTILLLDPEGKLVARTGYQEGGPVKYVTALEDIVKAHDLIAELPAKLATAKGLERAKLLDQLIDAQEKLGIEDADAKKNSEEIVTLDAENKAGLKDKYTLKNALADAAKLGETGKYAEAKAAFEKALALPGISETQKQDVYYAEGGICYRQKDIGGTVECLKKAKAVAPSSPKAAQFDQMIKRFEPIIESQNLVNKIKAGLEKSTGLDRAKELDQLIEAETKVAMAMQSRPPTGEIEKYTQEIITLDADNKAGLKTKYQIHTIMGDVGKAVRSGKFDEADAALKKAFALPNITAEQKAELDQIVKQLEQMKPKKEDAPATAPKSK